MDRPVIAIDGPSGVGKSTVAAAVAERLGLRHVDTGAFYRAATLAVLEAGVAPTDEDAAVAAVRDARIERRAGRTYLDGEEVEDEIRGDDVTAAVSTVAAHPGVRSALVPIQHQAVAAAGGVVEGRDIGTVVFPEAGLKVFLTATEEERARRRARQSGGDRQRVARQLADRDARDSGRPVAPLSAADDAWLLDTSELSVDEVVDAVVRRARDVLPLEAAAVGRREPDRGAAAGESASLPPVVAARQALPRVAVVGRPNVGKSTLVNRIIGQRAAIVEERPGVTRDRGEYLASWRGRRFVVVDTGGWEHGAEGLGARVVEQAERAIDVADVVVFVVDVTVGALGDDQRYATMLRRGDVPVLLAANKVDSERHLPDVYDLYVLGLGEPRPVSAAHGRGVGDLLDAVVEHLPHAPEEAPDEEVVPHVAVVGRPNVGKSSLFNRLVDEERSIVDPVPHTTRDSIDTYLAIDGEPWVFVDTAGLRRRYRHGENTELYSVDRTRRAIGASDLVLFVVDASEPLGEQDQRLAALVRDAGRGVVLVVNKWDLVDEDRRVYLEREMDRLLGFTSWAPRVNASALTGRGLGRVVPWLRRVWDAYCTRIPTGELNRWLEEATARVPQPSGRGGRRVRVKYMTQVDVRPPTFVASSSGELPGPYRRYLERELREEYGFVGSPIVIRKGGRRS